MDYLQYCIESVFLATPTALRLVNEAIEEVSCDLSCDQTDVLGLRLICLKHQEEKGEGESGVLKSALEQENEQVTKRENI